MALFLKLDTMQPGPFVTKSSLVWVFFVDEIVYVDS